MTNKLFGTDGIRGVANTYPLTADFCLRLSQILSSSICTKHKKVAIARDTRISGTMLLNSLAAGFNSMGIDVLNLGIIPTPLCTTLTPKLNVDMSIMITASHNPYKDNGLKLISASGDKFSDAQSAEVEQLLQSDFKANVSPNCIGSTINYDCGLENYISTVKSFTKENSLHGLKVVLDSANGAFSAIMPKVFQFLGAETISLSAEPNGYNINENCGSQHTEKLCQTVVENKYDIGIAVDGDGDRIIICDENGTRINGDQIIAYLTYYFKQHNMLKGNSAVATIYSNLGLGKYIRSLGVNFYASAVGERYVIDKMREVGSNIGGEESGHMVLADYSLTGDALLTAIVICLGIKESGKCMSRIFPLFTPFPSQSHNLRFADKAEVEKAINNPEVQQCIADAKKSLENVGSIIVRKSGTEPVIRLKIEHEKQEIVDKFAKIILDTFKKI